MRNFYVLGVLTLQSCRRLLSDPFTFITVLLAMCGPFVFAQLPLFAMDEQVRLIREQSIAFLVFITVIYAVISLMRHVRGELENGMSALLFSRPIFPGIWYIARVLGVMLMTVWIFISGTLGTLWGLRIAYVSHHIEGLGVWTYALTALGILFLLFVLNYFSAFNYSRVATWIFPIVMGGAFTILSLFPYGNMSDYQGIFLVDSRTPICALGALFFALIFTTASAILALFFRASFFIAGALTLFVLSIFLPGVLGTFPGIVQDIGSILFPNLAQFWYLPIVGELEQTTDAVVVLYTQDFPKVPIYWSALITVCQCGIYLILGALWANRMENR